MTLYIRFYYYLILCIEQFCCEFSELSHLSHIIYYLNQFNIVKHIFYGVTLRILAWLFYIISATYMFWFKADKLRKKFVDLILIFS
jgi:hypothetical protein